MNRAGLMENRKVEKLLAEASQLNKIISTIILRTKENPKNNLV